MSTETTMPACTLLFVLAGCSSTPSPSRALAPTAEIYDPAADAWQRAGSPGSVGSFALTATLLSGGKVAVVGGNGQGHSAGAELYDAATGTWTRMEPLPAARHGHASVLLADGRLLVVGGFNGAYLEDCETLDPRTLRWSPAARLAIARDRHTATLLDDGRVLVAGGFTARGATASVELYDTKSGRWTPALSMTTPRAYHTATLLSNGKVLVAGGENGERPPPGDNLETAEIYDPQSGTWTGTGSLSMPHAYGQTASLLAGATDAKEDRVFVAGGEGNSTAGDAPALPTVEEYGSSRRTWRTLGPLASPRFFHTATVLPDGKLLVTGGYDRNGESSALSSAELFDPGTGKWIPAASMATARAHHAAVLLPDGKVLVIGGDH